MAAVFGGSNLQVSGPTGAMTVVLVPVVAKVGVAVVMLLGARWRPGVPFSLLGVAAATVLAETAPISLARIGVLPAGVPAPSLSFLDLHAVRALLPAACAAAALAALESLLSATVADAMSVGERHDPDRELFGQGLATIAAPVFGGIPATAAIARTAVNVRAGARSKLASLTHAVALAAIVLAAAPLVGCIPLAALAGVLLATTVRMVEAGSLLALARSTRGDALVLILTFTATVALDLVTAAAVGVGVAIVLALRAVARTARIEQIPLEPGDHSAEEHALLAEHIVAYRLDGPLFFAAAHTFLLQLSEIADVRVVILRMSRVSTVDATGAHVLGDAINRLQRRGITVLLSGIAPGHDEILTTLGVAEQLRRDGRVFPDTPTAIAYARTDVLRHSGTGRSTPPNGDGTTTRAAAQ